MAGEVRNQLTVTLNGGAGSPSSGSRFISQTPVSREIDTMGPMGAMASYAAQRQTRWGRVIAEEISRDREAARGIEDAVMRHQALAQMDLASTRRASEAVALSESFGRRDLFLSRVRGRYAPVGGMDDLVERKLTTKLRAASKLGLRDMVRGSFAAAATSAILPEGGGITGSLGRIAGDTVAGAAFGGQAGAAFALIWSSINEVKNSIVRLDRELQDKRKLDEEVRRHAAQTIQQVQGEFKKLEQDTRDEFQKFVKQEAGFALSTAYRESRYINYNLVP